ncbi:MAG: N-formylglutamate amidohydrolase [Gemmobacter sp.]
MHQAYDLYLPARRTTPVVFASPHSGRNYAPGFLSESALDPLAVRSSEDAFVDLLFADAPDMGAPLLAARAPRAWLDLNRAPDELDPALIDGAPRGITNPRISSGLGVIPRVVANGRAIYRGKLRLDEARARIESHWHPYHARLRELIAESQRDFGVAVLIDCHSMPHEAIASHARAGRPVPEIVLGDRFGAAAAAEVVDRIEQAFRQAGFLVARNTPFAGAYVSQAYGRPDQHRHVVQVEIDRALYMDEARVVPLPGFRAFRERIGRVIADITVSDQPRALAAE